jgi:hypothetical protein
VRGSAEYEAELAKKRAAVRPDTVKKNGAILARLGKEYYSIDAAG